MGVSRITGDGRRAICRGAAIAGPLACAPKKAFSRCRLAHAGSTVQRANHAEIMKIPGQTPTVFPLLESCPACPTIHCFLPSRFPPPTKVSSTCAPTDEYVQRCSQAQVTILPPHPPHPCSQSWPSLLLHPVLHPPVDSARRRSAMRA